MRRPPLVSASLRETRFLCLSQYLERERETKSCRMDMQQKCCNNNTRSLPASPDTVLPTYLYTFPSTTRPTDQPTTNGLEMSKRESARSDIIIIIIHIATTHRAPMQDSPIASARYLPDFSPSDTRDLPDPTLSHLISPFFWIPPKNEKLPHCSIHLSIHPSERTGPVVFSSRYSRRNCQKSSTTSSYLRVASLTNQIRQYIA